MGPVEPFETFLARTAADRPEQYAEALRDGARRAGISAEQAVVEFERMKAHILHYYDGMHPVGSYPDAAGNPVDCVPFEQQPAFRAAAKTGHGTIPTPPPPRSVPTRAPSLSSPRAESVAGPAGTPVCPPHTVPLPRVTLERLIFLGTLDNHFRKEPHIKHAPPAAAE